MANKLSAFSWNSIRIHQAFKLNCSQISFDEVTTNLCITSEEELRRLAWIALMMSQYDRKILEQKPGFLSKQGISFLQDFDMLQNKIYRKLFSQEISGGFQQQLFNHRLLSPTVRSPKPMQQIGQSFQFHVQIDPKLLGTDRESPIRQPMAYGENETREGKTRNSIVSPIRSGNKTLDMIMRFSDQKISLSPHLNSNEQQYKQQLHQKAPSQKQSNERIESVENIEEPFKDLDRLSSTSPRLAKPKTSTVVQQLILTSKSQQVLAGQLVRTQSQFKKSRRIESFENVMENLKSKALLPPRNITPRKITKPFQ